MKIKKNEYLPLDHEAVCRLMEGELTFVNYMNVGSQGDVTAAIYRAAKPNLEKGHKEFMLLYYQGDQLMVSGMTREQIKKYSKAKGVLCTSCDTFLFSVYRHDYHTCGCPNGTLVDGGRDYLKTGGADLGKIVSGTIDLLNDQIVLDLKDQKS